MSNDTLDKKSPKKGQLFYGYGEDTFYHNGEEWQNITLTTRDASGYLLAALREMVHHYPVASNEREADVQRLAWEAIKKAKGQE